MGPFQSIKQPHLNPRWKTIVPVWGGRSPGGLLAQVGEEARRVEIGSLWELASIELVLGETFLVMYCSMERKPHLHPPQTGEDARPVWVTATRVKKQIFYTRFRLGKHL